MLILNGQDVIRALPMEQAVEAMLRAYAALSAGQAEMPLRTRLAIAPHEGQTYFMPAFVADEWGEALAIKIVSVFPGNLKRGMALLQAAVLVLEADTGRPAALLEGGALTAIRTGAASGAATSRLARSDSRTAAVFGAGIQGRTQLEAVCTVRDIRTAWVYDPNPEKAAVMVAEMAGKGRVPADLRQAATPGEAAGADIVCTATPSTIPVFADGDLQPGVHINGVGSYTAEMQEIPIETIMRARVVVDSRPACLAEAGDLIQPLRQGRITEDHIQAELGEIVLGRKIGRQTADEVTFFKSVGVAVQDAAAAQQALRNAQAMGLGQHADF